MFETLQEGRFDWMLTASSGEQWRGSVIVSNGSDDGNNGNTGRRKLFTEDDLIRLANLLGKEITPGARRYLPVYVVDWARKALEKGLISEDDDLIRRAKQSERWHK